MKAILFVLPYYKIGGTLTSFINLIDLIDKSKYEVDVFALKNEVDDYSLLPKGINYLGLDFAKSPKTKQFISYKKLLYKTIKIVNRLLHKLRFDFSDYVFRKMAVSLSDRYSCVIAFQEGQATRMAQYISAPYRIAWVHCIYSRVMSLDSSMYINPYYNYDKIVCVSRTAANDMIKSEPSFKRKIHVVYNAVNKKKLFELSSQRLVFSKKINFVSIGRIDPVKRFSSIPMIASSIRDCGLIFDWWIVGGVAAYDEYENLINEIDNFKVSDFVHPIGALSNPYPYIKSCDLLICLSLSETFNYTIAEAKVLGTPVVSTDFPSAYEFIEHNITGFIFPIEKLADGLVRLLKNVDLLNTVRSNLASENYSSLVTKLQFQSLLNNE